MLPRVVIGSASTTSLRPSRRWVAKTAVVPSDKPPAARSFVGDDELSGNASYGCGSQGSDRTLLGAIPVGSWVRQGAPEVTRCCPGWWRRPRRDGLATGS